MASKRGRKKNANEDLESAGTARGKCPNLSRLALSNAQSGFDDSSASGLHSNNDARPRSRMVSHSTAGARGASAAIADPLSFANIPPATATQPTFQPRTRAMPPPSPLPPQRIPLERSMAASYTGGSSSGGNSDGSLGVEPWGSRLGAELSSSSCSSSMMAPAPATRAARKPRAPRGARGGSGATARGGGGGRKRPVLEMMECDALTAFASEERETQSVRMENSRQSQLTSNRTEQTRTVFGATGLPTESIKTTVQVSQQTTNEQLQLRWELEKTKRASMLQSVRVRTLEANKTASRSYIWYDGEIREELRLFRERLAFHEDIAAAGGGGGDAGPFRWWAHEDFQLRFLFGLPNSWDATPHFGVPWLACLWTMAEMLDACHDPRLVAAMQETGVNAARLPARGCCAREHCDAGYFAVGAATMVGYISGHLLAHCTPQLNEHMNRRPELAAERASLHFPRFREFSIDDAGPARIVFDYDFHRVPHPRGVPVHEAPNRAAPLRLGRPEEPGGEEAGRAAARAAASSARGSCYVLGSQCEDSDAALLHLLNCERTKAQCMLEVERVATRERIPEYRFQQTVDFAEREPVAAAGAMLALR